MNLQSIRPQMYRAIQWASNRIGPNGEVHSDVHDDASAFATAWCIRILAQETEVTTIGAKLVKAVNWLLFNQLPNGAWASSAWMRVPPPNAVKLEPHPPGTLVVCDQNSVFTTATVLAALNAAHSSFLKMDMKEIAKHAI